ncbi:MAG: NAD(P)H-hydrate dehydratase [Thiothrix sp.]|nr:MAG: NAD(P)H-hydrate dehydratase [Thiothrix sp.]
MVLSSFSEKLPVYTIEQVRELDRIAIQVQGIPGYELMTRAAKALWQAITVHYPQARSLCVICGAGNNAGDGYVLARLAHQAGWIVSVIAVSSPTQLQHDAKTAYQDYVAASGQIEGFTGGLPQVDLVVDALFGTGLTRPLEGLLAAAVNVINACPKPVIAVDIPSGLNGNTGQPLGVAVKAALTVTFIGLKQGLLTGQARDYVGDLMLANLDLPEVVIQQVMTQSYTLSAHVLAEQLPKRSRCAHKGKFGHVLLIGGQAGMAGAIRLAGEAALRTGSGLVTVGTDPTHAAWLNLTRPELMVAALQPSDLAAQLAGKTVIGLGPGLGQTALARVLWATTLASDLPLVLDADALNLLAQAPQQRANWILTPHPAEAARLLGCSTQEIEQDRLTAIRALQQTYGGVIVLKGAGSLIADAKQVAVCLAGNPGMSTAGMGDVLTGIITSLLGQGLSLWDAACTGVLIHALAGDEAAKQGERGMLAGDLIHSLRNWVNP